MRNIKHVTVLAAIIFFIGLIALTLAANPMVTLLGKLAIGGSLVAFAAVAINYVMKVSFAMHSLRNEDFHWH